MAEYIITPEKKEIPSSHLLSEELHRRAISVEMEVKGTNYKWESIYFYDPISPETQCFVERNLQSLVYKVSLTPESTHESEDLQKALVVILLSEVGGKAYEPESKESYDLMTFLKRSKELDHEFKFNESDLSPSTPSPKSLPPLPEILWIFFAWALVLFGIYIYYHVPPSRKMLVIMVCFLALISAGGITFSKTKPK